MKTKKIFIGLLFVGLVFASCSKDSNTSTTTTPATTTPISATDVVETQKIDQAFDDVALIADDQYEVTEGSPTGKGAANYTSILPSCATISDLGTTDTVRNITITFGSAAAPCVFRGRTLKGQLILTRTKGTTFPKTMTITYLNFYSNGRKLEGTTTWTRTLVGSGATLHPKTTYTNKDLKLTNSSGIYYRSGELTREMTAGFSSRTDFTDDVYSITGGFTTTNPAGTVFTSLVEATTPLVYKAACGLGTPPLPYPVSGILKLIKDTHTATIDYGTGDCDAIAWRTIDGGTATQITLGN